MKKRVFALAIVLALLLGILLGTVGTIIVLEGKREGIESDIPKSETHDINNADPTADTMPPIETIGNDQEESWNLPEF